jgi:2-oxoglutarate ferredoxin oxidoreductase subunit gamma
MTHEILFAGFGGQGVLSMGMTLAYAGVIEGKEVSWMPSYGPEMRGGTTNCIVTVSNKTISSPIANRFDALIALNQPSLDKFQDKVKTNGLILYETATIVVPPMRTDLTVVPVAGEEEARRLGNARTRNMVMLGAFLSVCEVVHVSAVVKALAEVLPERYHNLLRLNEEALRRGEALVIEAATPLV